VGTARPVKKVFFLKGKVIMDEKTPEEYGDHDFSGTRDILSMPMNTSPALGLPSKITGSNQARPYVELLGEMRKGKGGLIFQISRKGKSQNDGKKVTFKATYETRTGDKKIEASGTIRLNIARRNYFIEGKNLFQLYVDSGALTEEGGLTSKVFRNVCENFFDYVKERAISNITERKMNYTVVVLPSQGQIEYRDDGAEPQEEMGIDSFGETFSFFPSKTTQTAKFMSYDDKAFTINFLQGEAFYRNLHIGNSSHRRIEIDADMVKKIAGLEWIFAYTGDPYLRFQDTKKGIYHQLYHNYRKLEEKGGPIAENAQMVILCIRRSQAKREVLLHENLTMDRMRRMFSAVKTDTAVPTMALELLIQKRGRSTIWSEYLNSIRALLAARLIQRQSLISTFSRMVREQLQEWQNKEKRREAGRFFERSEFCRTILSQDNQCSSMDDAEDYAYRVGRIVGRYVKFKEQSGETSSSLRDILTYSKYDRDKLRFAVQRVGLGINLSKTSMKEIDQIARFVKEEMTTAKEIPDDCAYNDYSYFFYKGAFETMV